MYCIQYKLNLKQTPLQSIQVPTNFKCPEYIGDLSYIYIYIYIYIRMIKN